MAPSDYSRNDPYYWRNRESPGVSHSDYGSYVIVYVLVLFAIGVIAALIVSC